MIFLNSLLLLVILGFWKGQSRSSVQQAEALHKNQLELLEQYEQKVKQAGDNLRSQNKIRQDMTDSIFQKIKYKSDQLQQMAVFFGALNSLFNSFDETVKALKQKTDSIKKFIINFSDGLKKFGIYLQYIFSIDTLMVVVILSCLVEFARYYFDHRGYDQLRGEPERNRTDLGNIVIPQPEYAEVDDVQYQVKRKINLH